MAEDLFDPSITNREHAIFELGIKLASLFHMMLGAPVKNDENVLKAIANGIKASIECQPFVTKVDVKLNVKKEGMSHNYTKKHDFDYTTISGKHIEAEVIVVYKDWKVTGRVEWNSDLYYPLMRIVEIKTI